MAVGCYGKVNDLSRIFTYALFSFANENIFCIMS